MDSSDRDRGRRSSGWPLAVTVIAVVAILVGAALYVFHTLSQLPGAAARQTEQVLAAVEDIAAAFRQGTIETRFASYAASVSGSKHFQFATLERMEVFTREDRTAVLWGTLELPEVVVSATAPVEYTAYLDFDEPWHFRLEGRTLWVTAPPIRFNTPAVDASRIEYDVRQGSLFRDEEAALRELKSGLTRMSMLRTRELLPLVRDTGRRQVEEFVRVWLLRSFADGEDVRIEVAFADEIPPTTNAARNQR